MGLSYYIFIFSVVMMIEGGLVTALYFVIHDKIETKLKTKKRFLIIGAVFTAAIWLFSFYGMTVLANVNCSRVGLLLQFITGFTAMLFWFKIIDLEGENHQVAESN